MNKLIKHLRIVGIHRRYVRRLCFKMGLFAQGLLHDLSKYSPTELKICKYYVGDRSPHEVCREQTGGSVAWIHHYHKNKHHYQAWWDTNEADEIVPMKMPYKYVIEMFCDRVAACKAYQGKNFKKEAAWNYYMKKDAGHKVMHADTEYLLKKLLWNLHEMGEADFVKWYRKTKRVLKSLYDQGAENY